MQTCARLPDAISNTTSEWMHDMVEMPEMLSDMHMVYTNGQLFVFGRGNEVDGCALYKLNNIITGWTANSPCTLVAG